MSWNVLFPVEKKKGEADGVVTREGEDPVTLVSSLSLASSAQPHPLDSSPPITQ